MTTAGLALHVETIDELFRSYVGYVWRILRYLGVHDRDLEDQTQEVFIVVQRHHASWNGEQPRAWLYAIGRRVAAGYRRKAHHRREVSADADHRAPAGGDLELRTQLEAALGRLDEDKRAIFVLYEIEEMTMREVADAVGCPLQTAYGRLYAARRELASALGEEVEQ